MWPHADLIISAGTAGGFKAKVCQGDGCGMAACCAQDRVWWLSVSPPQSITPPGRALPVSQGAAIGDVFVSTGKMHHDRRIPLPGFDKFGIGYVATLPTPNMQKELGLKQGAQRGSAHAQCGRARACCRRKGPMQAHARLARQPPPHGATALVPPQAL